jgi:phospholipase/carboxylesterase
MHTLKGKRCDPRASLVSLGKKIYETETVMTHPIHFGAKAVIPKVLVIFFHGFGANGDNLLDLAYYLETIVPEAVFVSPNAFTPIAGYPGGYQWFPLDDRRGEAIQSNCEAILPKGRAFVKGLQQQYNIPPERTFFVGFSQGTMTSLALALSDENLCGGVIGCSGGLYMDKMLVKASKKLPIHLIHGEDDEVVDFAASQAAIEFLESLGFSSMLTLIPGLGHSIDERVLKEMGIVLGEMIKGKQYRA